MLSAAPVAAVVAVSDLDRARQFYGETLGLKVSRDQAPEALFFEAGQGTTILVYRRPNHQPSAATVVAFNVADIKAEVTELSGRGVVFEDYDFPGLKTDADHIAHQADGIAAAWFSDPEGNIISIATM